MPFFKPKLAPSSSQVIAKPDITLTTNSYQVPIFLIPGILGNGNELHQLATQIYNQSEGIRPIYIYTDQRHFGNASETPDLEEQVAAIHHNMTTCLDRNLLPYVIVGYSYGAILASEVAKKLHDDGQEVHLFLLDGASPELTLNLYKKNDKDSILEIAKIVNYAARISGLTELKIDTLSNNPELLNQLLLLTQDSQFQQLGRMLLVDNPSAEEDQFSKFLRLIDIAKSNLQAVANINPDRDVDKVKLQQTCLLTLGETERKFGHSQLGWGAHFKGIEKLDNDGLKDLSHADILHHEAAQSIASRIISRLYVSIPKLGLIQKQMGYLLAKAAELPKAQELSPASQRKQSNTSVQNMSLFQRKSDALTVDTQKRTPGSNFY